ncbi:MAG: rhomboid family intramembrane serine protease [Bacteroidales bacterium]|nr:rhomboid family intramembrane serine protease [Bacteroidales bacterium]
MYQTQSIGERISAFIKDPGILPRLILINVGVWLLINLSRVIAFLFQTSAFPAENILLLNLQNWLAVPAAFDSWIRQPWTLLTYMFVHFDFWHLFFNLLWLYWFGKIFLEFQKGYQLLRVYIFGGIIGGLVFMLSFNTFPAFAAVIGEASAIGASASVLAIVVATAFLVPDYVINLMFIGQVKIKYIAMITLALDIFMLRSGNAGGHFAHLGGAIAGTIFALMIKNRILEGVKFPSFSFNKGRKSKTKFKTVHNSGKPLTDEEYNQMKVANQKKIDSILDKIAKSGYKSLTEAEKEFLFKYSNKS